MATADYRGSVKPASFRKAGLYQRMWRGVCVIAKYSKFRHPRKTVKLALSRDYAKAIGFAWRYLPGRVKADYTEFARKTHWNPYEYFTASVVGRLFTLTDTSGQAYYPYRAYWWLTESLDIISSTIGALLVRGVAGWKGLVSGATGYVLTSNGDNTEPTWQAPSGGGGGGEPLIFTFGGSALNEGHAPGTVDWMRFGPTPKNATKWPYTGYANWSGVLRIPASITQFKITVEYAPQQNTNGRWVLQMNHLSRNLADMVALTVDPIAVINMTTQNIIYTSVLGPFNLTSGKEFLDLYLFRDPAHAQDTYNQFVWMLGVKVEFL